MAQDITPHGVTSANFSMFAAPACMLGHVWRFEVFKDVNRGWRWRLIQANALIVTESLESFDSRGDASRAVEKVREEILVAPVEVR